MDRIEPRSDERPDGEQGLPEQGYAVFHGVAERSGGVGQRRMAVNLDPVQRLPCHLSWLARRDDGNAVPGVPQRASLLPNASVERDRAILDNEKDGAGL